MVQVDMLVPYLCLLWDIRAFKQATGSFLPLGLRGFLILQIICGMLLDVVVLIFCHESVHVSFVLTRL